MTIAVAIALVIVMMVMILVLVTVLMRLKGLETSIRSNEGFGRQSAESVQRLEKVIAGSQSKGAAGENILETMFSQLPPEWQERNFTVNNKDVEFGLRLPNNLILPIDSKWPATTSVQEFHDSDDFKARQRLKKKVADEVLKKAKEIRKYIDPKLTTGFGVAVVPDGVYELCGDVHCKTADLRVMVISHGMFVPYLLLVYQMTLDATRTQDIDQHKLDAHLRSVEDGLDETLRQLDKGKFAEAIVRLNNYRDETKQHLAAARSGLTALRIGAEQSVTEGESNEDRANEPDSAR